MQQVDRSPTSEAVSASSVGDQDSGPGNIESLTAQVEKLRGRLKRERKARQEAELIAERGLTDLFNANTELDQKVTERTQELEVARSAAESAYASHSKFLANISHDLRTPINGIVGMLELLDESVTNEQSRQWVRTATKSANNLQRSLTRMLLFVDLDREIDRTTHGINLQEFIERTVATWRQPALKVGQLLTAASTVTSETFVMVDETILNHYFEEILSNVISHGSAGSIKIRSSREPNGEVTLSITDSGPGMDAELLKTYLAPLADRSQNEQSSLSASGIGLSLALRLAEQMNASLSCSSSVGGPTAVTLRFEPNIVQDRSQQL